MKVIKVSRKCLKGDYWDVYSMKDLIEINVAIQNYGTAFVSRAIFGLDKV